MKKSIAIIAVIIGGLLTSSVLFTNCSGKKSAQQDQVESDTTHSHDDMKMDSTQIVYACPMHPEVTGKEGDKCSKCGMKLEALKSDDDQEGH